METTGHCEAASDYYDDVFKSGLYNQAARAPLYHRIISIIKKYDSPRVLEIGCGTGDLGKLLVDARIPYRGFDFSQEGLRISRDLCPQGDFRFGQAYDPAMYQPVDYNVVVALEVLEHVDDLRLLGNIPPGVRFVASVPDYDDESHLRLYTDPQKDIIERFAKYLDISEVGVMTGKDEQTGRQTRVFFFQGVRRLTTSVPQPPARHENNEDLSDAGFITTANGPLTTRKLHLGCGRTILDGWVNLDCTEVPGVNVIADLDDCAETPLPFDDDYFEEFLASHLIEHITNPLPLMQELHRIARNNAKAVFRLPYGSSDTAFEDPTHVRPYFIHSFGYFSQPFYWRADYQYRGDWAVEKITLAVDRGRYEGKKISEIALDIERYRNVVKEMIVELRAVKPIRPPRRELIVEPKIELAFAIPTPTPTVSPT